ncbi:hypothetical protein BV898_15130 [Hypsibius exemplaris]|uniref:Uncharacterized protein n=1 Tax=Hypsibius exemplaris TaxID=2072580 RepID=A0A9X6NJQ0_HYPEX|nr:hypothetical protein BV898_15130 [Hypsibius exemplaris]
MATLQYIAVVVVALSVSCANGAGRPIPNFRPTAQALWLNENCMVQSSDLTAEGVRDVELYCSRPRNVIGFGLLSDPPLDLTAAVKDALGQLEHLFAGSASAIKLSVRVLGWYVRAVPNRAPVYTMLFTQTSLQMSGDFFADISLPTVLDGPIIFYVGGLSLSCDSVPTNALVREVKSGSKWQPECPTGPGWSLWYAN